MRTWYRGGGWMSGDERGWDEALAELEASVAALEAALEGTDDDALERVWRWEPHSDLGPLPVHLAPRAAALAERMATAEAAGRRCRAALTGELERLGRRREAGTAYARQDAPFDPTEL